MPRKSKASRSLVGGAPAPSRTGMKSQRRRKPRRSSGQPGSARPTSIVQTNPAAIGVVYPRAFLKRGAVAQQLVDQDPGSSERITGCDLMSAQVLSTVTTGKIVFSDAFNSDAQYTLITPSSISTRLQAIEEMYQWYAFRRIKFTFVPNVGSTTVGSIALGYSTDPGVVNAIASPTQQQVLEFNPALLVPTWGSASMEMVFRGTKLYVSDSDGDDFDTAPYQGVLAVAGTGPVTAMTLGQLWVEYDCDFYQQVPLLTSVDLFARNLPCRRCGQRVLEKPIPRGLTKTRLERKERKCEQKSDDLFVSISQDDLPGAAGPLDGRRVAAPDLRTELRTPAPSRLPGGALR